MSAIDYQLATSPADTRRRELWLQHAAGFIMFENIRKHALGGIDQNASAEARSAAEKAVDDTMYGLMMLIDGVSGGLRNTDYEVDLRMVVRLMKRAEEGKTTIQEMDLRDGDGVCMGFHYWKEGDFGGDSIIVGAR